MQGQACNNVSLPTQAGTCCYTAAFLRYPNLPALIHTRDLCDDGKVRVGSGLSNHIRRDRWYGLALTVASLALTFPCGRVACPFAALIVAALTYGRAAFPFAALAFALALTRKHVGARDILVFKVGDLLSIKRELRLHHLRFAAVASGGGQ